VCSLRACSGDMYAMEFLQRFGYLSRNGQRWIAPIKVLRTEISYGLKADG
jgi:hypothetical protein